MSPALTLCRRRGKGVWGAGAQCAEGSCISWFMEGVRDPSMAYLESRYPGNGLASDYVGEEIRRSGREQVSKCSELFVFLKEDFYYFAWISSCNCVKLPSYLKRKGSTGMYPCQGDLPFTTPLNMSSALFSTSSPSPVQSAPCNSSQASSIDLS